MQVLWIVLAVKHWIDVASLRYCLKRWPAVVLGLTFKCGPWECNKNLSILHPVRSKDFSVIADTIVVDVTWRTPLSVSITSGHIIFAQYRSSELHIFAAFAEIIQEIWNLQGQEVQIHTKMWYVSNLMVASIGWKKIYQHKDICSGGQSYSYSVTKLHN